MVVTTPLANVDNAQKFVRNSNGGKFYIRYVQPSMSALSYTMLDDAFQPLGGEARESMHKRKRRENRPLVKEQERDHQVEAEEEQPVRVMPLPLSSVNTSLVDEISVTLPYMFIIFMLLVLGMLYDMRQTLHDMRTLMGEQRSFGRP